MAGIPPLGGFFGKWFVFSAAVNAGLVPLAVFGVLSSVIGAFYYIRIIKVMYVDEVADALDQPYRRTNGMIILSMAVINALMVFVLSSLREGIMGTLPYIAFIAG